MTNHVTEFEGTNATHICTLTGTLSRPEQVYIFVSGWYKSDVVKVGGGWKIQHRTVHIDNHENFVKGALAVHMQALMEWMADNGTVV